jgi:hypothetical protein
VHADLSRFTHRPDQHFSAVIAQQGRVQLDADLNEQAAIQVAAVRGLVADLIGPDGGPRGSAGFTVTHLPGNGQPDDLTIGGGRYYVDGISCDAGRPVPGVPVPDRGTPQEPAPVGPWTYWSQPDAYLDPELPGDRLPGTFPYLVYLQVWERVITAAEQPTLREVALGPTVTDTAARIKVVWQVRAVPAAELGVAADADTAALRAGLLGWAGRSHLPGMAARAHLPEDAGADPCLMAPDARYRGPENQLYRVEIHRAGTSDEATLKWSRENGAVVVPVDTIDGTWAELATLGGDDTLELSVGDWVELVDPAYASRREPLPLQRVEEVDLAGGRVRLSAEPDPRAGRRPPAQPYLRRWDHTGTRDGAVPLVCGRWMPLEDGVEVYFPSGGSRYATGDYWQIPARTATGNVEWPTDGTHRPLLVPPAGIALHHAPLAWITGPGTQTDLRQTFPPLAVGA